MPIPTSGKTIIYKSNCNLNPVPTFGDLPIVGADNTLYIVQDTAAIYIWDGVEYIVYDSRPYKSYVALISQNGTNAPTATILENTLGGTVVWSYDDVGQYHCTLAGAFPSSKTNLGVQAVTPFVRLVNQYGVGIENLGYFLYRLTNDIVVLKTTTDSEVFANNVIISPIFIEIRVYP